MGAVCVVHAAKELENEMNKPRLLIVDDEQEVRKILRALLDDTFEVVLAESADVALEVLKTGKPFDLVLIDEKMPSVDGWQLLKALRELPDFETLPCVLITGIHDESVHRKALEAGFADSLGKPPDFETLCEHLIALLGEAEHSE